MGLEVARGDTLVHEDTEGERDCVRDVVIEREVVGEGVELTYTDKVKGFDVMAGLTEVVLQEDPERD